MMDYESLKPYLLPLAFIAFIFWRRFKFQKIKKQVPDLIQQGAQIVDVRTANEFSFGSSPGSINIPLDQLSKDFKKLDPTNPVILCCASGSRSGMAVRILKEQGFENVVNAGSWSNTVQNIKP